MNSAAPEMIGIDGLLADIDALKQRIGDVAFMAWAKTLPISQLVDNGKYRTAILEKLSELDSKR